MATIKAGTYRFADVLTFPTEGMLVYIDCTQSFTYEGVSYTATSDAISVSNFESLMVNVTGITPTLDAISTGIVYLYNIGGISGVDGWQYAPYGVDLQTITIPSDSEVSDEFYEWFTANAVEVVEETPVATVTYNGSVIASLNGGQRATLKCEGLKMESDVTVEVGENVGGSGSHVIEVDELPTENIDEGAVYLSGGSYWKWTKELTDVLLAGQSLATLLGMFPFIYHYADTRPTENIAVSTAEGICVYYIADESNLFCYVDNELGEWITLAYLLGAQDIPFGGAVTDASEATEEALYALIKDGWKNYLASSGMLIISESGTYDVADKASANVQVPSVYIRRTMSELPPDAPLGSIAFVTEEDE